MRTFKKHLLVTLSSFVVAVCFSAQLSAERPTAPNLFPEKTLVYFRVDDSREMQEKLRETSMGRMGNDPQIKPILQEFYSSLVGSLEQMQEAIGINLDEMLSIPNGEFAFALVPTKEDPAVCLLLEAGDEIPAVEILIERMESSFEERGRSREEKDVAGIKLIGWQDPNRSDRQFGYFIQDGVVVLSSNLDVIDQLAKTWTGNAVDFKPLANNRRFTNIMSMCVGAEGERPQASFFADPIAIAREATKSNGGATMVMAMLPAMGIDGIQGVGGSMILRPNGFDSIFHVHMLLANPRKALMQVFRPESGSTEPEKWVSNDIGTYMTANWNVKKTLAAIEDLVETFQGEGAFKTNAIDRASKELGIDFQVDFLDNLADRFSMAQVFIRPAKLNSGSNIYAIHLKDGSKFATDVMPKIYEKLSASNANWKSRTLSSNVIYEIEFGRSTDAIRAPKISMTVVEDCILIGDSDKVIDEAILTFEGQRELLRDSLDFGIVKDKIKEQLGERETSIISFQRPEESLRLFYDLASDKANIDRLRDMSENNPLFASLVKALDSHSLPPFEVIAKYFAPTGMFVFEEESGLHMTSFSMRRED